MQMSLFQNLENAKFVPIIPMEFVNVFRCSLAMPYFFQINGQIGKLNWLSQERLLKSCALKKLVEAFQFSQVVSQKFC